MSKIIFGTEPILECSSKGDKRFSAFYAKIVSLENKSIEELYQMSKKDVDGNPLHLKVGGWKKCKGLSCSKPIQSRKYYKSLWELYFKENPHLIDVILQYNGFTDMFGQKGHANQAEEVYAIWTAHKIKAFY